MAKPLVHPPPSSSVARLLDMASAARAVAPVPPAPHSMDAPASAADRPSAFLKREFVLSAEADGVFQGMLEAARRGTGTRLTASHLLRAVLRVFGEYAAGVAMQLDAIGPTRLPSNAKGSTADRIRFEDAIAEALVRGIRSKRPEVPPVAGRTWGPPDAERF